MLKEVTPEQKRQIIKAYDDGMKAALNSVLEYFPEDVKAVFKRQLVDDAEMVEANDYFKCNFVCNDDIEEAEVVSNDDIYECEICGKEMTEKDQAIYDQFSQIDFNCCKSCAESRNIYDD